MPSESLRILEAAAESMASEPAATHDVEGALREIGSLCSDLTPVSRYWNAAEAAGGDGRELLRRASMRAALHEIRQQLNRRDR